MNHEWTISGLKVYAGDHAVVRQMWLDSIWMQTDFSWSCSFTWLSFPCIKRDSSPKIKNSVIFMFDSVSGPHSLSLNAKEKLGHYAKSYCVPQVTEVWNDIRVRKL